MQAVAAELPPKKPKPPPTTRTNRTEGFYGPIRLWEQLRQIAADEGYSASELVVGILERWAAEYVKSKKQ